MKTIIILNKFFFAVFLVLVFFLHWFIFGYQQGTKFISQVVINRFLQIAENFQAFFLVFAFLTSFIFAVYKRIFTTRIFGIYLFFVFFCTLVYYFFKFNNNFFQICYSFFLSIGLFVFPFLSGKFLEKINHISLKKFKFKQVFLWSFIWFSWVTIFYAILKFFGIVVFSDKQVQVRPNFLYLISVYSGSFWASISEEVLYRLYLINFLKNLRLKNLLAVFISSTFFALAHVGREIFPFYIRIFEIFPVGVGLGILYLNFGFFFVFLVHFFTDIFLLGLPVVYLKPTFFLFLVFSLIISFFAFNKIKKKKYLTFGIFFVFFGLKSLNALDCKSFCQLYFSNNKNGLSEASVQLKLADINKKLVESERQIKFNFFFDGTKFYLTDFLSQSLKKEFQVLKFLENERWQIQSGVGFSWLLYDTENSSKVKFAEKKLEFAKKNYQEYIEQFYYQNFLDFLEIARFRILEKKVSPWLESINKIKIILGSKKEQNLIPDEKFHELFGQIQELEEKVKFIVEEEKFLEQQLLTNSEVNFCLDTFKEEKLLLEPEQIKNFISDKNSKIYYDDNFKNFKDKESKKIFWRINLDGKYFISGDNSNFSNLLKNFETSWQVAINFNIDFFNKNLEFQKNLEILQEELETIRIKNKFQNELKKIKKFYNLFLLRISEVKRLKINNYRIQSLLLRNKFLFQSDLNYLETLLHSICDFFKNEEDYLGLSFSLLKDFGEILVLKGEFVKWLEAGYEI